jgi:hypothetical protein
MLRPMPLTLEAFPAPVEVSLLVCINSPIYLALVSCSSDSQSHNDLRLQKLVAALQLLVFVLDDLYAIDDVHEAGLQGLGLSSENG